MDLFMNKIVTSLLLLCSTLPVLAYDAPHDLTLNDLHKQGLNAIVQDLSKLHTRIQTSSYTEVKNHPRITITGDWNQVCLTNLMTLIQNQGLNRKLMNDGAITTLDMMLDLVDPFMAPFTTLKRFLTSEVIEEMILEAIKSDDPEGTLKEKLEEKIKENNASLPEGAKGERLLKQMEQLMELYQLAQENKRLPEDAKWNSWDFDPGRSTADDFLPDYFFPPNRVIPSQAMAQFRTVDPDDSPVDDNTDGKGLTLQRVIMMGVAEAPYPASSKCVGQILDYKITIHNYGHVKDKKFITDYIEYEIELNCCEEEEDENISFIEPTSEPISYLPGGAHDLGIGGSLGYGRVSSDNLFCGGLVAQYFPDGLRVNPCGARPALGVNLKYDYQGNSDDNFSFQQNNFIVEPQLMLFSKILPQLDLISAVSVPVGFGTQRNEFSGQVNEQNINRFGVNLTAGLSIDLNKWQVQAQTDVLGWSRQTLTDPNFPDESSTSSDFSLGLNKRNALDLSIIRKLDVY